MVVGKLGGVRILLGIGVGDGLVQSTSHGNMVREVCRQPSVEVSGTGLQMSGQSSVLHWEVVILFLVHFLVDHVLLGHT